MLVAATLARCSDELIVSHQSAAILLGLPWLGPLGRRTVVTDPRRAQGQTRPNLQKIAGADREIRTVVVDGRRITAPVVIGVDIALREPVIAAVIVLDAILARGWTTKAELVDELERRPNARARSRARAAIDRSDGGAQSPGESLVRVGSEELGAPKPELQHVFWDGPVMVGKVDLYFPRQRVIVEFDGRVKYSDPTMRSGRSPAEVVIAEKLREDELRRLPTVDGFVRLSWDDAYPGGSMPRHLLTAGIPLNDRWPELWTGLRRTLDARWHTHA
jgi:hypothetical protein